MGGGVRTETWTGHTEGRVSRQGDGAGPEVGGVCIADGRRGKEHGGPWGGDLGAWRWHTSVTTWALSLPPGACGL